MPRNVQESLAGRIGILRLSRLTQRKKGKRAYKELDLQLSSLKERAASCTGSAISAASTSGPADCRVYLTLRFLLFAMVFSDLTYSLTLCGTLRSAAMYRI